MRTEFSRKTRAQAFQRANGHCEICGLRLFLGKFRFDHRIPDWLGGEATLENCVVQCAGCDAPKTAKDQGDIAKVKRIRDHHTGAMPRSRRPIPGSKGSGLRKRMDGRVERRDE